MSAIQLLGGMAGWSCLNDLKYFPVRAHDATWLGDPEAGHILPKWPNILVRHSLHIHGGVWSSWSPKKSGWIMSGCPFTVWTCFCALLKAQCIRIPVLPRHDRYGFVANGAWKMSNMGWYHLELETCVEFLRQLKLLASTTRNRSETISFVSFDWMMLWWTMKYSLFQLFSTRSVESWS